MSQPDERNPNQPITAAFAADIVPYQSFAVARAIGGVWETQTHDQRARIRQAAALSEPVTGEACYHTERCWNDGARTAVRRVGGIVAIRLREEERLIRLQALPGAVLTPQVTSGLIELLEGHEVRYLTQSTVRAIQPLLLRSGWRAVERRDDADYVYRVDELSELSGKRRKARREARAFAAGYDGLIEVREGRLDEPWTQRFIAEVYLRWLRAKYGSPLLLPAEVRREWRGVLELPADARAASLRLFALTVAGEPVAASVMEPMWNSTWVGTVFKSDRAAFLSATAFLRRHVARVARQELGPDGLISLQQDDGEIGLRRSKLAYGPHHLEPKFALVRQPSSDQKDH